MINKDEETYLTTTEALYHAGDRSYSWLADRVADGRIPFYRIEGKTYYRLSDIDVAVARARTPVLASPPAAEANNGHHTGEEDEAEFYTLEQVARKLNVSRSWVWHMSKEGKIEVVNLTGKARRGAKLRVPKDAYARFIGAL